MRRLVQWFCAILLFAIYVAVLLAPFLAPYPPTQQNRQIATAPPTRIHWVSEAGTISRPFVYRVIESPPASGIFHEDRSLPFPIRILVEAPPHTLAGLTFKTRLFGVDSPAFILLLGSDEYGRDIFSRLLHGGRISLLLAPVASAIAISIGLLTGGLAGYFGGRTDLFLTAAADSFLSVPWLYLVLTMRASLPLELSASAVFLFIAVVLGLAGWARPARMVRGVVLSAKERDYVLIARGFGASDAYLLRRHILPQTRPLLKAQFAILIPAYILAEATFSFFGLGFAEPTVSWGTLIAPLQRYSVLVWSWWLWSPVALLTLILACFQGVLYTLGQNEHRRWPRFH